MKSKNREINIFNMSLLDILTGALGAFMFMMLSFVPYYNIVQQRMLEETSKDEVKKIREENDRLRSRMSGLEAENAALTRRAEELQQKVSELLEQLKRAGRGDVTAEELAKLQEENARLRQRASELEQRLVESEAERQRLADASQRMQAENEELKRRIDEMDRQLQQLAQAVNQIQALQRQVETLSAQNKSLLGKLAAASPEGIVPKGRLRKLVKEYDAMFRTVTVALEKSDGGNVELLLKDPDGHWFDASSTYPGGRKSVRFSATAGDAFLFAEAQGFNKDGQYLLVYRRVGAAGSVSLSGVIRLFSGNRNKLYPIRDERLPSGKSIAVIARVSVEQGKLRVDVLSPEHRDRKELEKTVSNETIDPIATVRCDGPVNCKDFEDTRGDLEPAGSPTPTPSLSPSDLERDRALREDVRRRAEEIRRSVLGAATPTVTPRPAASLLPEQMRELIDRRRQREEQRQEAAESRGSRTPPADGAPRATP